MLYTSYSISFFFFFFFFFLPLGLFFFYNYCCCCDHCHCRHHHLSPQGCTNRYTREHGIDIWINGYNVSYETSYETFSSQCVDFTCCRRIEKNVSYKTILRDLSHNSTESHKTISWYKSIMRLSHEMSNFIKKEMRQLVKKSSIN